MFKGLANRAWILFLVLGVCCAAPYWAVTSFQSKLVIWPILGWGSVGAVLLGIRLHKPKAPAAWYLLAASATFFIVGDNIYSYKNQVQHSITFPSIADGFYLAMYPLAIAGLALLVRRRTPGRDRASVIDAAIITTALAVGSWVFLIEPYVHGDMSVAARLTSMAYPLFDVAMLAIGVRLAVGGGRKPVAFYLLMASIVSMLVSDALYGYTVLNGSWHEQHPLDVGWIVYYLLWGAAALHPSMRQVSEPAEDVKPPGRRRMALIGVAAVGPSVLLMFHTRGDGDIVAIAIATIVMFGLVLVRLNGLVREVAGNELSAQFREAALLEAKEHSHQKSVFLANMSHEIRTPLNGVVGMIELLRSTELNGEQRDFADTLANSAEYLSRLVEDVLDFSRVEAGKLEVESEAFELRGIVDAALTVGASRAQDKGLELLAIVEADVPTMVVGDHVRVRQVLGNLVSNATKFTNTGHVVVRVSRADTGIRFDVTDTGVGLPIEGRERLFEQFVQEDQSTTRRYGGSGLGLAICRQLVTLMGGEIGVTSERGRGSTFWFSVPFAAAASDAAGRSPLRARRVLVASSQQFVGAALRHSVEYWGGECIVATTHADALSTLTNSVSRQPFDALIIDAHLDASHAIELATEIRGTKCVAAIPVIVLTTASRLGAEPCDVIDAWMAKPVRSAALLDCIETMLHVSRETVEARPAPVETRPPADTTSEPQVRRVLIVEDNLVNQKVAVALLTQLGYQTDVANDGVDALTQLEHASYDAILMDCQMPRMDGYETTLEIRRRENGTRIPIIAMTASALYSDRERCMDVGMDDYLTKPINRETLATTLVHFINAAV